jgi:hypothetical protein
MLCYYLGLKGGDPSAKLKAMELVGPYYRAIGRLILYSIIVSYEGKDGEDLVRFFIGSHVIANIYRNYFLRGIDPTDEDYNLSDLLHDVIKIRLACFGVDSKDRMKQYVEFAGSDGNDEATTCEDLHTRFRETAKKDFIDDRSIAVGALKEGITLALGELGGSKRGTYHLVSGDFPVVAFSSLIVTQYLSLFLF